MQCQNLHALFSLLQQQVTITRTFQHNLGLQYVRLLTSTPLLSAESKARKQASSAAALSLAVPATETPLAIQSHGLQTSQTAVTEAAASSASSTLQSVSSTSPGHTAAPSQIPSKQAVAELLSKFRNSAIIKAAIRALVPVSAEQAAPVSRPATTPKVIFTKPVTTIISSSTPKATATGTPPSTASSSVLRAVLAQRENPTSDAALKAKQQRAVGAEPNYIEDPFIPVSPAQAAWLAKALRYALLFFSIPLLLVNLGRFYIIGMCTVGLQKADTKSRRTSLTSIRTWLFSPIIASAFDDADGPLLVAQLLDSDERNSRTLIELLDTIRFLTKYEQTTESLFLAQVVERLELAIDHKQFPDQLVEKAKALYYDLYDLRTAAYERLQQKRDARLKAATEKLGVATT